MCSFPGIEDSGTRRSCVEGGCDGCPALVTDAGISWNYTTWLNIVFLLLAAVLVIGFIRSGGMPMLQMMGGAPAADGHGNHHHGSFAPHAGPDHRHGGQHHEGHDSGGRSHDHPG